MWRSFGTPSLLAALLLAAACATTSAAPEAKAPVPAEAPLETALLEVRASASPVAVDESVELDADMVAFLAPKAEAVQARASRLVGTLATPLERGKPESTMGNFATDAMREGLALVTGSEMDLCFTNAGGLRRNLEAGAITEGLLVELMPFDNSVVVFDATPAQLQLILDRLAQRGDPVSGITYKREGEKAVEVTVGGAALGAKDRYRLCTNDYVFEGGGGYPFEGVSGVNNTGALLRDVFIEYFERRHKDGKAVSAQIDGRAKP